MASQLHPSSSTLLIIGCGTWGASTALHLARRGYQCVTVLDPYEVPSPISAGNDVNKIKGFAPPEGSKGDAESDEEYTMNKLVVEATKAWESDPVFKQYYHDTGYVIAASSPEHVQKLYEEEEPTRERGFVEVSTAEEFRNTMPPGVLTGDFPNWRGWYKNSDCGWVHARKALVSAAMEAQRLGVKLITGNPAGYVTSLVFEDGDIRGAQTADGSIHRADRTILCAGASAPQLLDMKNQLRPTAWTLAHIKMTDEEMQLYRDLPVLFNVERGFFMEPDEDSNELKICDEHPGYCNWEVLPSDHSVSTPFAKHEIPLISEKGVRLFLEETMPHLKDRAFSFARICWCADTPDRNFLISSHPSHPSLMLGVGGSGHGFMHIPVIGGYIVDCMEEMLDQRMKKCWRWRPESAVGRDWTDVQHRMGGSYKVLDLRDIASDEWTSIGRQESKL